VVRAISHYIVDITDKDRRTSMYPITVSNEQSINRQKVEEIFDLLDVREETRTDYKYRIGLFLDYVSQHDFNHNVFLEFKRHLGDRVDIGISTKNKYLITAKVFLKELNRQGILPADITQNIKVFAQTKKHKKDGINENEMRILTDAVRALPLTPPNMRLKAILSLLALQGLREVEVVRLDVRDIDFASRVALVKGKGRDDEEPVSLHPETVRILKDYMKANKVADGALFRSHSNNSINRRLTTRGLRSIIKQTLGEMSIDKNTHGFRHYFTTKLIKTYKGDLLEVARYTRHRGLEMLQVYNDNINKEADLPRFYGAFDGVSF
jgi:integrase/recombinase XerC